MLWRNIVNENNRRMIIGIFLAITFILSCFFTFCYSTKRISECYDKSGRLLKVSLTCLWLSIFGIIFSLSWREYNFRQSLKSPPKHCTLRIYYIDGGIEDKNYTYHACFDVTQYLYNGSYCLKIKVDQHQYNELGAVRYKIINH